MNLNGNNIEEKRVQIKEYFLKTYTKFEKIFEMFIDDKVFYLQSEPTRQPMIFYFGHTAAFFINKLILMKIINNRINPNFESIFAVGVDEMSWDDTNQKNYRWPSVNEVRDYRNSVKKIVLNLIDTIEFQLPITQDSPMWIILMGIEHENIHIETSLVLHRQLPIKYINQKLDFNIYNRSSFGIKNSMVDIPSMNITLGKDIDHNIYGWDNEYGKNSFDVQKFSVSKYLVSNEEYMSFVEDGGYQNKSYWCDEGLEFLDKTKVTYPTFWIKQNGIFRYRAINKIIDMPLSWSVDVNYLEAKAFCKYKSKKDNVNYTLPSEVQYKAMYKYCNINDDIKANNKCINHSSCCVNLYNHNGIFDVVGNVWQWCSTTIYPFDGFKEHKAYDDFSIPTFDNKHYIINGSSWASYGNLIHSYSRYAFRPNFYQNAGFRYIIENKKEDIIDNNIYETDTLVSQYCEFQYGNTHFGVNNFSISISKIVQKYMTNSIKALDIGCATGRLSFELARYFNSVDGIDFSTKFIQVGVKLKQNQTITYKDMKEGDIYIQKTIDIDSIGYKDIKDKVSFWQGDACNLKPNFNSYDMITATNLIDRLYSPKLFLDDIKNRLNKDGILIITSPYTWLEEYTKKENWLGGYKNKDGQDIYTIDSLKKILSNNFKLLDEIDVPFVIKETKRKYQYTIAQVTVWKRLD